MTREGYKVFLRKDCMNPRISLQMFDFNEGPKLERKTNQLQRIGELRIKNSLALGV